MPASRLPEGRPLSIVLLTRSLDVGGTERQLVELAIGLRNRGHAVRVAVFYAGGALAAKLEQAAVDIVDLGKSGRWDMIAFLARTASVLRRLEPDVIYSFLGGGNIVASVVRPFARPAALIWSIRNSQFDRSTDHWLARLAYRLEASLARTPDAIIANSSTGRAFALARGFPEQLIRVVPNGIDTARFRPNPRLRTQQRGALGLSDEDVVVGVLARLNATKDLATFLRAAALVAEHGPEVRFLCVGTGPERAALEELATQLGIAGRAIFTGELDAAAALNAFDIACSTSLTEGFSNAIAEAMACGLPCIVTDVGDSAAIVGNCGTVVAPGSPAALAQAIEQQIKDLPAHDPSRTRQRIIDNYSVDMMVDRTLEVFRSIAHPLERRPSP